MVPFPSRSALFSILIFCSAMSLWAQMQTEPINGHEAVAGEVLVRFRTNPAASLAQIQTAGDIVKTKRVGGIAGLYLLHSRSKDARLLVQQLSSRVDVLYAEPNFVVHAINTPNDPGFPQLWGLQNTGQFSGTPGADISAVLAWDISTGSRNNVVAVVDTGIDYTHPDLAANVWSAPASFTVTVGGVSITCSAGTHGFNAITNVCDPMDDHSHGSHVSGTIGAVGNNSIGVVGVNWVTSIMGVKFLDSTGTGTFAGAIDAIEFAVQAKAAFAQTHTANVRVLSNSWGSTGFSQGLSDEINRAAANGMLFVAAAGNSLSDNDQTPFYPASYAAPNIIAVAATDFGDQLASFSNYGHTSVHLGAPGVNILSTTLGGTYQYFSGTSMATPHVSGAAMLLLSVCPVNTATLKTLLTGNVDLLPSLVSNTISGGRLNVNRAVRSCLAAAGGVSVSPGSFSFGNQVVATTSASKMVTLSNHQSTPLSIGSISPSADFALSVNNCGSALPAGASCTMEVTFTPIVLGYRSGTLTISDNASSSPQILELSGNGIPAVAVTPAVLAYPAQLVGTLSAVQKVRLTNNQSLPLNISSISTSGDFTQSNSCGVSIGPMTTCTIQVSFKPSATGARTGTLIIDDDGPGSPHNAELSGDGSNLISGAFVATSRMNHGRSNHTATLLPSGQVLVAGGFASNDAAIVASSTTAELYDSGTRSFTITGSMQEARGNHTATLLTNGKVLAAGGFDTNINNYSSLAEIYDPKSKTFTSTPSMVIPRENHTATLLQNGKVLIAGGYNSISGELAAAELYDPASSTFTPTGSMTTPRFWHTATLLNDGTVLITGGNCCNYTFLTSAEVYDPGTETFTAVGPMSIGRLHHTATLLKNGKLLIAGGTGDGDPSQFAELYDPSTKSFVSAGEMVGGSPAVHTATLLNNGGVLVAGGTYTAGAQLYDPGTGIFSLTGNMTSRRAWHTAIRLNNGEVLIAGGTDGDCAIPNARKTLSPLFFCYENTLASAELYTPVGAANVSLSASSLNFANQAVGSTSAPQAVTLKNSGSAALSIAKIAASGDFGQQNNCGASVAIGATCAISVTFKPIATGTRTGAITITDNAPNSPQTISLTGTGVSAIGSVAPNPLVFGLQLIGTSSASKLITLSNQGNLQMTVNSVAVTGDFAIVSNSCSSGVKPGTHCNVGIVFRPRNSGIRKGTLTFVSNATNSPEVVNLTGTGTQVSLSATSIVFNTRVVGTTSSARIVSFANRGVTTVTVNGISASGDFHLRAASTKPCPTSGAVLEGTSCNIAVVFTPSAKNTRKGALTISDSDPGSPQTVALTGTGTVVSLSTAGLVFAAQPVNTSSAPKTITVKNVVSVALNFTGISISGANARDFSETSTCGTSIAGGASCKISVIFKPSTTGTRTAAVSINDDGGGSPQKVTLIGTGQ